jgi:hypothetical protein
MPTRALPSAVLWQLLLVVGSEFLPLVAAWRTGRLRAGDPAGQVGLAWAFMNVCTVIQAVGFVTGHRPVTEWGLVLAGVSLPLLLTPPLLTWIGPAAKRWQPAVLAAFAALTVGALAVFGPGREYSLLSRTTAHAGLSALVLLMMATHLRRSANAQAAAAEPGWAWIAGGHLAYFLATLIGRALVEALIAWSRMASRFTSDALLILYAASMIAMGWGILVGARRPARADGASAHPLPTA